MRYDENNVTHSAKKTTIRHPALVAGSVNNERYRNGVRYDVKNISTNKKTLVLPRVFFIVHFSLFASLKLVSMLQLQSVFFHLFEVCVYHLLYQFVLVLDDLEFFDLCHLYQIYRLYRFCL